MEMIKEQIRRIIAIVITIALIVESAPNVICQAAEKAWQMVINPETPLDEVYFYTEDKENEKDYFYGYIDGKVAVMDLEYHLVRKTEFTDLAAENYVKIKGKNALVVRKEDKFGIMSASGDVLIEPVYDYLTCYKEDAGTDSSTYCIQVSKKIDGSVSYALLDADEKEIIGFGEYEELGTPRFKGGHCLVKAIDANGKYNLLFDGNIIYQEDTGEDSSYRYGFASYKDEECIFLRIADGGKKVVHYISYQGEKIISLDYNDNDDLPEHYTAACKEWLDEKKGIDEAYAKDFMEGLGKIEKVESKTGYGELFDEESDMKTGDYYWTETEIKLSYSEEESDDFYYVFVYDTNRECLISGRSFDSVDDESYNRILTDKGELCSFDGGTGKVSLLFEIDDSVKSLLCTGREILAGNHSLNQVKGGCIIENWSETERKNLYLIYLKKKVTYQKRIGNYYILENQDGGIDVHYYDAYSDEKGGKIGELNISIKELMRIEKEDNFWESSNSEVILYDKVTKMVYIFMSDRILKSPVQDMRMGEKVTINRCSICGDYISIVFWDGSKYIWNVGNLQEDNPLKYSVALDKNDRDSLYSLCSVAETDQFVYWSNRASVVCLNKADLTYSVQEYDGLGKTEVISDTEESETELKSLFIFNNQVYLEYNVRYCYDRVPHEDGKGSSYREANIRGVMDLDGKQCINAMDFMSQKKSTYISIYKDFLYYDGADLDLLYDVNFNIIEKGNIYHDAIYQDEDYSKVSFRNIKVYDDSYHCKYSLLIDAVTGETIIKTEEDSYLRFVSDHDGYSIFNIIKSLYNQDKKYTGSERRQIIYDRVNKKVLYDQEVPSYIWANTEKKQFIIFEKKESAVATPSPSPTATPPVVTNPDNWTWPWWIPSNSPAPSASQIPSMAPSSSFSPTPSAITESTTAPTPDGSPVPTVEGSISPTPEPIASSDPDITESFVKDKPVNIKAGEKVMVKGVTYKVKKTGKNRDVEYINTNKSANVTIPARIKIKGKSYKVTSIGKNALKNNKKLKTLSIGKNVKTIGAQAFSGCRNLTKITIGKKVKKIGDRALYQCKNLRYIMVKTNLLTYQSLGNNVFGSSYPSPRVKTDKKIWKKYSSIFIRKGMSGRALFITDPVKLVI